MAWSRGRLHASSVGADTLGGAAIDGAAVAELPCGALGPDDTAGTDERGLCTALWPELAAAAKEIAPAGRFVMFPEPFLETYQGMVAGITASYR